MNTMLLTLGRLPKALDIARSFHAAGWRVVVAEPFARTLVGASRACAAQRQVPAPVAGHAAYLAALGAVMRTENASLVVPVSEETPHVAHLPDARLFTMPPDLVLRAHHKQGFIDMAQSFGLDVPESFAPGTAEAAALAARADFITKPVHSCSGRGVRFFNAGDAVPDEAGHVVQRRIHGDVISSCSLAHGGRVASTVVYRGKLFSGAVAIAFERFDHPATEDWIARFVAATGWTGFISFDFILDAQGRPWGIECNPRTTSGLHFWRMEDIAPAVLDPAQPLRHRPERVLQQAYSVLTAAWGHGGRAALRTLFTTRDVSWSWSDPMPFLTMTRTSWPIIREAARRRTTFGEVATLDVGWNG